MFFIYLITLKNKYIYNYYISIYKKNYEFFKWILLNLKKFAFDEKNRANIINFNIFVNYYMNFNTKFFYKYKSDDVF